MPYTRKDLKEIVIFHYTEGDEVTASDLNTFIVWDKEREVAEEFHVDTPKKDGGKKKQKKYGWMKDNQGNVFPPSNSKPPANKPARRSLDAIFIAPSYSIARFYARALNYDPRNCVLVTLDNYDQKLRGISPDEDLHVHLVGWPDSDTEDWDADTYYDYDDMCHFLMDRGFDYEEIPEIGKPS